MRGSVAAGLGGAALVTIVAVLMALPGRLLVTERTTDPVAPAALPAAGVVQATVPAIAPKPPARKAPMLPPTLSVAGLERVVAKPTAVRVHHAAPARKRVVVKRLVQPVAKPTPVVSAHPAPRSAAATPVAAQPTVVTAAAVTPATTPTATTPAPTPVVTAAAIPAATPQPVSVTVGSGKAKVTLVATVRHESDGQKAQYDGNASSDQTARPARGADRSRSDGVRPLAPVAGEAAPSAPGAGSEAWHADRDDRGQAGGGQDRGSQEVGDQGDNGHGHGKGHGDD